MWYVYAREQTIVITSDTAISQIKELDEAVRRYFDSGFSVEIKRPAYEARLRILMQLSVRTDYVIPDAVASYIAQYVQTNVWKSPRQTERRVSMIFWRKRSLHPICRRQIR